ncbi:Jag N-terminal domain-containing protein [Campylobacter sp. 2018MI35]|uniref:Jag N-terminal domain-containing protein n=1 Tax=Campylobacter sp. 2018MI34 TaxID=2800582 RepID=UPI0019068E83|nr:Jag N-terminal domain-containing protein [Campylobacter sp. 2018MI34]MBK1991584.1 Jag N-terminal domain-containing protein [Campylobacter sp. 2018MI34]
MIIEEKDLQSALTKASQTLNCSVINLEYKILQYPKNGFLGFGRKNAIIEANIKKKIKDHKFHKKSHYDNNFEKSLKKIDEFIKTEHYKEKLDQYQIELEKPSYTIKNEKIFDAFYKEEIDLENTDSILEEIKIQLTNLLKTFDFKIELLELCMYEKDCILIRLDGEDSALMIGKEAHRYKAISYLLYSWINDKYKLNIRLEIAQFLENQSKAMDNYLCGIIEKVKHYGRAQTKPLDGVLIKIALEKLREQFPDKYVAIKQNNDQKFIIISDFFKKHE